MSQVKKKSKPSYVQRHQKETVNKKAIIWAASVIFVLIVALILLLVLNQ